MLWVYGNYKYFNSFIVGTVFACQNLTSKDPFTANDGYIRFHPFLPIISLLLRTKCVVQRYTNVIQMFCVIFTHLN